MHEAGIAAAVADTLRRQGADEVVGARVRLLVSGGHSEPADFDGALRLHLAAIAPELDVAAIEIVHRPVHRLCIDCGRSFAAVGSHEPCPRCGGSGLAVPTPESVEIELLRPDAAVT